MDRMSGGVGVRAVAFVAAKWLVLLGLAFLFRARWPRESPTREPWENWMVFGVLVALCVTLNFGIFITLVRPRVLSGFARVLVFWFTVNLVMFEFGFLGAQLWPEHFSLGQNWRLRTISLLLLSASAALVVALLRTSTGGDLPPGRVMTRRVGAWLLLLSSLAFLYWFVGWWFG